MRFALLVLYAAGTLSAPVVDKGLPKADIKGECPGSRFSPGTTFEYEYEGDTIHKVEGTTQRSTGLQMSTKVLVSHLKECTFHMRLTDVELRTKSMDQDKFITNPESAAYKDALQKNDLAFTMKGNTITSVQSHASETTEMLNIKRGILSTLQLDETVKTETDVHGTCETKITNEDGLVIKTKSLSDCSDRTQEEIGIQSSSIKTTSNMKPLESKSMCTYAVEGGLIRKVICDESHLFRPFSGTYEQKAAGAMTLVRQQLKLLGKKPTATFVFNLESYTVVGSVLFDHTDQESKADSLPEAAEVVIQRMVDASHLSAKETSANEFTSLVRMFRKLDQRRMTSIWNKYFDCTTSKVCAADDSNMKDLYRQYLLDAIAYCGTPTCVSVVKDVTIKGEIDGERANMFLQSIALLAKTTNAMIRDVLEIAQKKPSRQVFLTLGTLISRHCSKSPEECGSNSGSAIVQAENFLLTTLKDCSGQENHERVEQILLVLKAIGNAKRPLNAQDALITCAKNSKHANITMSAFEAMRGMPCNQNTLEQLRGFVANENIDADKRIYAFKTSMQCANKKNLELLVHQYNIEENKQVSSFMWTYFTNILETSNPDLKQVKAWLTEIIKETPLKKTDLPMYQFSKHFEKSLYIDSLETGATATADVVFHPDGFLPSTAMFDVSAKVMGVPVDVIQTAIGIDGVETILENVFGPDGAMPKDFGLKLFNWTVTADKLKEMAMAAKGEGKTRQRRAARRDDMPMVNDIHEAINMKPPQPSGFMTLKVMGQEVRIMSYDDIYAMIDQIDNMNVIQLLLNIAKGGKKTFSKSVMFLEMTHSVPTGLGLPLKLKLAGSSVGTVELNGKFDIRNMFWGPGALSINGFVKPSAVVEISGSMSTESNYVSTGLRVVSNMMVSNMLKGSIDYKQNALLKINLDTPTEPLQLFKMSSTPFMFLNEQFLTVEGKPGNSVHKKACLKSQLVGLGMCACARIPLAFRDYASPYFPLTGPTHVGFQLVRGDEKLTTIQFKTTMKKQANGLEGLIEFSTPGAVYERKLSANMIFTDANNDKILTVSTNEFGKTGSLKVSYNSVTSRTAIETKNNFLTPKEVTTRVTFFNQTGIAAQQFGVQLDAEYDWYKFKHVTKFVNRGTSYMLEAHTEYAPKKSITSAIEINTVEKKARAIFDINQIRQAVEIVGKLENTENEKGMTLQFVHVPTNKKATLYTGYKIGQNKKEIMTSANIFGKSMKNILGWYQNGEIQSIEDFLLVDGKTAKFGTSWEYRKDETAVQFSADVFGRKAISTVIYNSKDGVNTVDLSSRVLDNKEVSGTIVLTNRPDDKTLSLRLNTVERPTEASIGFTKKDNKFTLMASGKGFDQRAKVFWTLDTTGKPTSSFGFGYNKYSGGFRMAYYPAEKPVDRKACASVYYKTDAVEKTAATGCLEYIYTSQENMKQLAVKYSVEVPEMKKKLGVEHVLSLEQGRLNAKSNMKLNDQVLSTEALDLVYRGLTDMSLGYEAELMSYKGSFKWFSQKESKSEAVNVGMDARFQENSVSILNKYEGGRLVSSASINGNALPITTEVTYEMGNARVTPGLKINVGKYALMTSCDILYGNGKYGGYCRNAIMQDNLKLFGLVAERIVTKGENRFNLQDKLGFTLMGKDYMYGYSLDYATQTSDVKRVHYLTAKLHYSATRASTIYLTLADGEKTTSLSMDVEYIPSKRVTHYVSYNKINKQLDASIEFLPTMFAKLSTRLEDKFGYQLTTRASLQWEGFSRSLNMFNSYVNDDKEFMISTSFASDISVGLKYSKLTQTLSLFAKALGKDVQLSGTYQNRGIEVILTANGKNVFSFTVKYDQLTKTFRMLAAQQEKIFFDVSSGYNKFMKAFKLAVSGMSKWGGVYIADKGQRTIITVNLLGKGLAKVIVNKKDLSVAVQSLRFGRASTVFKYTPKSKTLTMSAKTMKNRLTVNLRTDYKNKIFSLHYFLNKGKAGLKVFFLKKAMIAKVIAGPKYTFKLVLSKSQDNIKMQVQRIYKGKIVNQALFKYGLSTRLSEVMFKWNAKVVNQLKEIITPLIEKAMNDIKEFVKKIASKDGKLVEISEEVKAKVMEILGTVDKAIADLDIEPLRQYVKTGAVKTLKEISDLVLKALMTLAKGLDEIKANTPMVAEKISIAVKNLKSSYDKLTENLELKADVMVAKVKLLIQMLEKIINEGKVMIAKGEKEGRAFVIKTITEGTALLKKIQKEIAPAVDSVSKVLGDVQLANSKVAEKVVQLVKDFKVRGMTLEEMTSKVSAEGQRLIKMYIEEIKKFISSVEKEATKQFEVQTANVLAMLQNLETIVKTTKVPYTDKTIVEVTELIRKEIERLVTLAKSMDAEKIISETTETISKLVKAKAEDVEKIIKEVTGKYIMLKNKLPELTREMINKIVVIVKKYASEISVIIKKVELPAPVKNYIMLVKSSLTKHFGPLLKDIDLPKLDLSQVVDMIKVYVEKLLDGLKTLKKDALPLYKDAVKQVRKIKVMGFRLGPLFDMQVNEISMQLEKVMPEIMAMKDKLVGLVQELKTKSPTEVLTKSLEEVVQMINVIIESVKKVYEDRDTIMKKTMTEVQRVYSKLQSQYEKASLKSFDEVLQASSQGVMLTTGEMSSFIKQLVAMDLSEATWKAFNDADLMGRFQKLGVNDKIQDALKYAKRVNVTKFVLTTLNAIQEFVNLGVKRSAVMAMQTYAKIDKVVLYLKSIPKKDYETWLSEVAQFTVSTKELVQKNLDKVVEISQKQALEAYKTLEVLKTIEIEKYNDILVNQYISIKDALILVATKCQFVYNDLEQPTIELFMKYRNVVAGVAKEQYAAIKTKLVEGYGKIVSELKAFLKKLGIESEVLINNLKTEMNNLVNVIDKAYTDFMAKYGDMTWEQIGMKVEETALRQYEILQAKISKILDLAEQKMLIVKTMVLANYEKALVKFEQFVTLLDKRYSELKVKITDITMEYYAKYEKTLKEYEAVAKKIYAEVKLRGTDIYNKVKDKTLKQIVDEIKAFVNAAIIKQAGILKALSEKNMAKATQLINELQGKLDEVTNKIKTVVVPELKALLVVSPELRKVVAILKTEGESIINQTLRNTVVLTKEIIAAYTPLALDFKKFAMDTIEAIRFKTPAAIAQLETFIQTTVPKLVEYYKGCAIKCEKRLNELIALVKELIKTGIVKADKMSKEIIEKTKTLIADIKNNETYKKYVAIVEQKLEELKKIINELVKELKTNPKVIEAQKKVIEAIEKLEKTVKLTPKIMELRKLAEKVIAEIKKFVAKNVEEQQAFVDQKIGEIQWLVGVKTMELRKMITEFAVKFDPTVKDLISLMKQIQVSVSFTANKLETLVMPSVRDTMKAATAIMSTIPKLAGEALTYFAEAPEEAFWTGYAVLKEALTGSYGQMINIDLATIELMAIKVYTNALVIAKDVYNKSTDEWTKETINKIKAFIITVAEKAIVQLKTLKSQIMSVPSLVKKYLETIPIIKELINGNFDALEKLVKEEIITIYTAISQNVASLKALLEKTSTLIKTYAEEIIAQLKTVWDTSAIKKIIDNQIWMDIIGEIKTHEFVVAIVKATGVITEEITAMQKEVVGIISKLIKISEEVMAKEIAVLKGQVIEMVTELKARATELYQKGIKECELVFAETIKIVKSLRSLYEEKTIGDIVSMTINLYKTTLAKANEITQKLVAFAELNLKDLMKIVEQKAMELYTQMKATITPYYQEMVTLFKKYDAIFNEQFKEFSSLVIAKVEKMRAEFMAKYGKQIDEVIAKTKALVGEAITMYKTYTKLVVKELDSLSKLVKKCLKWLETEMNTIKKMTVKQSVAVLKKLPTDIKVFTTLKVNELIKILTDLKAEIMAEIDVIVAQGKEMYQTYVTELKAKVEQIKKFISTLKLKGDKVLRLVELYIADMTKVVYNIQKEVADTVVFVYNYYNIGEKYNKIKNFIIDEIMKIVKAAEKTFPELAGRLNTYVQDYKNQLKMFADDYESLLSNYARDAEDFTRTTMMSSSDILLRSVHKALVYVDNFDTEIIMSKLRTFVDYIKQHISIIQKEGLVVARFVHPDINSVLSYYTNTVKKTTMETFSELKLKGMEMLRKIETDLPALQKKIMELKDKIQKAVMKSTFEIRRDMNVSAKVLKNIALRLISLSKNRYATTFARMNLIADNVLAISETWWMKTILILQESYKKIEPVVNDIINSETPEIMYAKIEKYLTEGIAIMKTKYGPMIEPMLAEMKMKAMAYTMQLKATLPVYYKMGLEYLRKQEITMEKIQKTALLAKTYIIAKTERAVELFKIVSEELKKGVDLAPLAAKFEAWYEKWMNFVVSYVKNTWVGFCEENADLCKLIDEGLVIHKMLFKKYKEIVMSYLSVGKAHVDRAMRKISTSVNTKKLAEDNYLATAMIMGNRILTFDNKLYDFVEFKKAKKGPSPCSYLLARDFQDKKFTISKLDNALIVNTQDMTVKIRQDGNTKTTINGKNSFSLPVESGASKCVRVDNLILCNFEKEGLKVTVDLKNDFTTISISGWHKGKSHGLLGTYNNEAHDEWRMPNNQITSNINEFANAYELSGAAECQLDLKTDNTKVCDGKISQMCQAYFAGKESPFEPYFSSADPTPFMDACARETKCKKGNSKKAHCSIVAGYVALLRTRGVWVPQVSECMAEKGRSVNQEWTQKTTKAIDVVVMVSLNKRMQPLKKNIAQTMFQVHKLMKNDKFNVRYALVGFGGQGVHEAAHSHPLRRGPSVFGYITDLRKEIMKEMPFKGESKNTNDGYHAILTASKLKFRPTAEKVFILFNSEPHNSHSSGPSFDETKYILAQEANAPLFVFDTLNFANVGKDVIGETTRKIYTSDNLEGTDKYTEMPSSEFKELVQISKGGLFSNSLKQPKHVAVSLNDAIMTWVNTDIELCKKCILRASWTGQSKPICISDKRATC